MGKVKTQPIDWVWPPTPIAALPTSMGSGRYVLRVSCLFLHLFCSCFLLHLIFILMEYSLFCHGKGQNSYSASRISVLTSACCHVRSGASLVPLYSEVLEASAQVSLVSMFIPLWCKASVLCRWCSEITIYWMVEGRMFGLVVGVKVFDWGWRGLVQSLWLTQCQLQQCVCRIVLPPAALLEGRVHRWL